MPQYLIIREVAEGAARLVGITEETTLTPRQIADAWAVQRELTEQARLHMADITAVTTVEVAPRISRNMETRRVPPEEAFEPDRTPIIDLPDAPPPA